MTHWPDDSLVRKPIGPKTHWSENTLVRKSVIGPNGSYLLDRGVSFSLAVYNCASDGHD